MCPSVAIDLHTGERAKTDCVRARKMCPSILCCLLDNQYLLFLLCVYQSLHSDILYRLLDNQSLLFRKSKDWLFRRQDSMPESSDRSKHRKRSIGWLSKSPALRHIILPPRQPVFALSHVCRSVATLGLIFLPLRQSAYAPFPVSKRQENVSECNDWSTHRKKSKDWLSKRHTLGHTILPPKQPVFALSHVFRSVVTLWHIILPPRQPVFALSPVCISVASLRHIMLPPRQPCLGGRIIFPSVATDMHTGERANTGCLGRLHWGILFCLLDSQSLLFLLCRSVATLRNIILLPRQPVFALSPACISVATLGNIILPPRQPVFALFPVCDLHRRKSKDWLSRRQNNIPQCSDWSTHRKKSKDWLYTLSCLLDNQYLLFLLWVDQSLHSDTLFCLLDSQSMLFFLCVDQSLQRCPSVTSDLPTGERVNTGCLGRRLMCPSVVIDLRTGERANTGCLRGLWMITRLL
jgi:hypothetical protein